MPRSNWKGIISFGLVNIPIVLFNSEETSEKVSFHQIDKTNNARIKYKRINAVTGKEVPWENIIKGYQYDKETVIPVDEGELEKEAGENARTIAIENFINQDDIHPVDIYKTYYLSPDKNGEKGYIILREALQKTKKLGIARVIISTKEYLAAVATFQNALVLYLLRYTNEVKSLSELDIPNKSLKEYKVSSQEIDIANQLIKSMATKWKPEKYKDDFYTIVQQWAKNKLKNKKYVTSTRKKKGNVPSTNVINFADLLKQSLGSISKKSKNESSSKSKKKSKRKTHAA